MKTGSFPPRVRLNPVAVWELLDRLDIFQNQLARQKRERGPVGPRSAQAEGGG